MHNILFRLVFIQVINRKIDYRMIAVLTADLVDSTKLNTSELVQVTDWLENYFDRHLSNAHSSIYRGDEFQVIFNEYQSATYQTILLKLKLQNQFQWKQLCTMSLAFGEATLLADTPQTSQGPVFVTSGRGLEKTKRGEITLHDAQLTTRADTLLLKYVNHQMNKLTTTQIELLITYFENHFPEHKELALLTDTTRQNISSRLSAMGADLLRDFTKIQQTPF